MRDLEVESILMSWGSVGYIAIIDLIYYMLLY